MQLSEYEKQTLNKLKEGHTPEEQKIIENRFRMSIRMLRNSVWGCNVVPVSYVTTHFCNCALSLSEHNIISKQPNT